MKSVGFSPVQVMLVLLGQILVPAVLGCLLGIALGTLASQPFLQQTAHAFGLPAPFTAVLPVDLGVLALIMILACAAALVPAHRASHLSAVTAITRGAERNTIACGNETHAHGVIDDIVYESPV